MMEKLIATLERTLELLGGSQDSPWSTESVEEVTRIFRRELESVEKNGAMTPAGIGEIRFLILPTGALQDIAIDNGWGDEFLQLADALEENMVAK